MTNMVNMKSTPFMIAAALFSAVTLTAQNYPSNPEPGACYIKCPIEVLREIEKVVTNPSFLEYKVAPPVYKTVEERVLVREASKRFEYVPAVYREEIDSILVEEAYSTYTISPVKMIDTFETILLEPAYARFENKPMIDGCNSPTPGECDVICYVEYPAVTKNIPVKRIVTPPTYAPKAKVGQKYRIIRRMVIDKPATIREIEIPAEYVTVQKRMLDRDAIVDSTLIASVVREEVFLTRDRDDEASIYGYEWRKIECELLDYNILPIYYDVNSDILSRDAKDVIDEKLLKLMQRRPELRVEISSHTDSRASDAFNLELSNRRAKAVVDYLVSRGIRRSRLEYRGYGESQLVNQCRNGVQCTEEQHAQNRRTEFRVLPR
jgi:OOP family OmpA-OmpF porin